VPKKHSLKQLEAFAKDWGLYKWMNADNPDNEKPPAKKPYKGKPKSGKENNSSYYKRAK
jgi:hypothetical protein